MFLREDVVRALLASKRVPLPPGGVAHDLGEARRLAREAGYPVAVRPLDRSAQTVCKDEASLRKAFTACGAVVERRVPLEGALGVSLRVCEERRQAVVSVRSGRLEHEEPVDPLLGFDAFRALKLLRAADWRDQPLLRGSAAIISLYELFETTDAELLEAQGLAQVEGQVLVVAPSMYVDDAARSRHPDLKDAQVVAPRLPEGGSVGCVVSGRGLAMAVRDALAELGEAPSRMVDVGTAPTPKALGPALDEAAGAEGTRVVLASLVGLVHPCPELAEAVAAWHAAHPKARLVARLSGSEEAEARAFLERAGVEAAPSAEEAARIAAGGGRR